MEYISPRGYTFRQPSSQACLLYVSVSAVNTMVLCGYCWKADRPTVKGLRSHITQSPACCAARDRHAKLNLQQQNGNVLAPATLSAPERSTMELEEPVGTPIPVHTAASPGH